MKPFQIIELFLNPEMGLDGVGAISVVSDPAIDEDFFKFSKNGEIKFKSIDKEQKVIMGALLIPNQMILRDLGEDQYGYVYMSAETIKETSQLFMKNENQNNATLEHMVELNNMTVVESWIVEDLVHDKTVKYGMNYPVGTWVVSMKVYDDDLWNEIIKTGMVRGFSIEGNYQKGREDFSSDEKLLEQIREIVENTTEK